MIRYLIISDGQKEAALVLKGCFIRMKKGEWVDAGEDRFLFEIPDDRSYV